MPVLISKPAAGGIILILCMLLIPALFVLYPWFHPPENKAPFINWTGLFFLAIPLLFGLFLKIVIVGDGKIYCIQLLTGRRIKRQLSEVGAIVLGHAPVSNHGELQTIKKKDQLLTITFKTNVMKDIRLHGALQGNFKALVTYFKTTMPERFKDYTI